MTVPAKASGGKGRGGRRAPRADWPDELVGEIVGRYAARYDGTDKVRRCGPREDEDPEQHWRWAGNDGKPVMRDEQAARDCARQMQVATRRPHHAYRCPRSRSGHWHVAPGRPGAQSPPERRAAR